MRDTVERTVTLLGPGLDPADAQRLLEEAQRAFHEGLRWVSLDFSSVQSIDSRGVRCLVELLQAAPTSARVILTGVNARTRRVMEALGLDALLEIRDRSPETVQLRVG